MNVTEDADNDPNGQEPTADPLRELIAKLADAQRRAKETGLFVDERPLLECPDCHFPEDITADGFLITYLSGDFDRNISLDAPAPPDTGRRFVELSDDHFLCPHCGGVFPPPDEEPTS